MQSLLIKLTGDTPVFRIIDFLIDNKGMDFSKKEIANGAKISRASIFNHWHTLEEFHIVRQTRQFGKTKLYTLRQSKITKQLLALEKTLIAESMKIKVHT